MEIVVLEYVDSVFVVLSVRYDIIVFSFFFIGIDFF